MPDNVSVGKPESGAYGEGTDLANLKKALPVGAVGNPSNAGAPPPPPPVSPEPPTSPLPAATVGRPPGGSPPPGVPRVLLGPTTQPDTPVSTPLAGPVGPPGGAANPQQARLAVLDSLAHAPNVSPETREWAQTLIRVLVQPQGS